MLAAKRVKNDRVLVDKGESERGTSNKIRGRFLGTAELGRTGPAKG